MKRENSLDEPSRADMTQWMGDLLLLLIILSPAPTLYCHGHVSMHPILVAQAIAKLLGNIFQQHPVRVRVVGNIDK